MLTERQSNLLTFIDRYIRERGYLRQIPYRHRGIEVVRMPPTYPGANPASLDDATLALLRAAEALIASKLADATPLTQHDLDSVIDNFFGRIKSAIAAATPTNQQEPSQ